MRKALFFPRLAASNLYRNRATYTPYLLACIVTIVTFYTLLSMNFNDDVLTMEGGAHIRVFTQIGSVVLAIFCTLLLLYTNSFLIRRRKKELGLYSILGMEKRNLAALLFFETLYIALFSLAAGLMLGALLSRLIFMILLKMIRFPVSIDMPVSLGAMAVTAAFFGLVFLLNLAINLRHVRVANPVELLTAAREGEREPKASWLLALIGAISLGAGYWMAITLENPVAVIYLFFVAVLLVIVGTYCLFTAGSITILKLLRKNKRCYYHPKRFITLSGMIYRMKQNAAGLATICILSCMVLVTVSSTLTLYLGAEDSLLNRHPYEVTVSLNHQADGEAVMNVVEPLSDKHGLAVEDLSDMRIYASWTATSGEGFVTVKGSDDDLAAAGSALVFISLVPLEDYNASEGKSETLAPGEALFFVTGGSYQEESLTLDGITYRLRRIDTFVRKKYGRDAVSPEYVLVLPDVAAIEAAVAATPAEAGKNRTTPTLEREIRFDLSGSDEAKMAFYHEACEEAASLSTAARFSIRYRGAESYDWYTTYGGFLFLGIYFGILFMLAAAMIIYYKQLSEGSDDIGRYEILQKVGMSSDEVKATINSQILTVFFLPLVVAVVHILFAFNCVRCAVILFGISNITMLVIATAATVLIYAACYTIIYRATTKTYYNLVRRKISNQLRSMLCAIP